MMGDQSRARAEQADTGHDHRKLAFHCATSIYEDYVKSQWPNPKSQTDGLGFGFGFWVFQNPYFTPNCMIRISPVFEVIRPNVPALNTSPGLPQLKLLSRLNASRRSSTDCALPKAICLASDISIVQKPGPRMLLRS